MDGTAPRSRGRISLLLNMVLVALQFIVALIVLLIMAVRFHRTAYSTAVYVIFLGVLTIVITLALAFLTYRPSQSRMVILGSLVFQALFVILWAGAAGALGTRGNTRSNGVRAALALSLIEMILFFISSVIVSFGLWRGRRATTNLKHGV